jgi:histidine ammonia-lyase
MAMGAAWKLRRIVNNVAHVLAIELMCGAQAIDFRAPLRPALRVARLHAHVRELVPRLERDRVLSEDIAKLRTAIGNGTFDDVTHFDGEPAPSTSMFV